MGQFRDLAKKHDRKCLKNPTYGFGPQWLVKKMIWNHFKLFNLKFWNSAIRPKKASSSQCICEVWGQFYSTTPDKYKCQVCNFEIKTDILKQDHSEKSLLKYNLRLLHNAKCQLSGWNYELYLAIIRINNAIKFALIICNSY